MRGERPHRPLPPGELVGIGAARDVVTLHNDRGSVEKMTLMQTVATYCAVPMQPEIGGGIALSTFGGETETASINTFGAAVLQPPLVTPNQAKTKGPIRAITIAPDSPISVCDVWVAGVGSARRDCYRVSVGRPWIGDVPSDDVLVTLPIAIPNPFDSGEPSGAVWDAGYRQTGDVQWPLRLEVFRGDVLPMSIVKRAPYVADARYSMTNNSSNSVLWVCTEGRSSIELCVRNTLGSDARLTVKGWEGLLGASTDPINKRVMAGFILDAVSLAVENFRRVYTEKFPLYEFRVDSTAASSARGAMHIVARDD